MTYGNKRDYPKIDIYWRPKGDKGAQWQYAATTTWSRTCREAVANYQPDNGSFVVMARFQRTSR